MAQNRPKITLVEEASYTCARCFYEHVLTLAIRLVPGLCECDEERPVDGGGGHVRLQLVLEGARHRRGLAPAGLECNGSLHSLQMTK